MAAQGWTGDRRARPEVGNESATRVLTFGPNSEAGLDGLPPVFIGIATHAGARDSLMVPLRLLLRLLFLPTSRDLYRLGSRG